MEASTVDGSMEAFVGKVSALSVENPASDKLTMALQRIAELETTNALLTTRLTTSNSSLFTMTGRYEGAREEIAMTVSHHEVLIEDLYTTRAHANMLRVHLNAAHANFNLAVQQREQALARRAVLRKKLQTAEAGVRVYKGMLEEYQRFHVQRCSGGGRRWSFAGMGCVEWV